MRVIAVATPRTNPTCLPSTLYLFVVISAPNAQAMQSKSADASELSTIDSEETSNTFCPSTSRTTAAKAAPIKPTRYTRALFIRAPYHNRFVASPNCGQPRTCGAFLLTNLELQASAPNGDSHEKRKKETRLDHRTGPTPAIASRAARKKKGRNGCARLTAHAPGVPLIDSLTPIWNRRRGADRKQMNL